MIKSRNAWQPYISFIIRVHNSWLNHNFSNLFFNFKRTESYFVINLPILDIDNKKLQKPPPVFTTSKTSNLTSTAKPEIERKTDAVPTTKPDKPEKLLPKDLCSDFECKNGGSCNVENETPKCTCLIDFAGDNCESEFIFRIVLIWSVSCE